MHQNIKNIWEETKFQCCAYIGIHTVSGHEVRVLKKVKQINNVEEAFRIYGLYDIIVKLKAKTKDDIKQIVTRKIDEIDKVRATSMIILKTKEEIGRIYSQIPSPMITVASS
ncbi:MAG: Lrp/AsnC ligand binding domain-containing protein [Candidatus Bathyarchaeota archaeon]|nr:Lrp/AsnC ligand binding domain-containing protein [Candidatus Bathyarchaeota archaeon]